MPDDVKTSTDAVHTGLPTDSGDSYRRLQDIERMSSVRFRFDNSVRWARVGTPIWRDTATGMIVVDRPFELVGWCDKIPTELMHGQYRFCHPTNEQTPPK